MFEESPVPSLSVVLVSARLYKLLQGESYINIDRRTVTKRYFGDSKISNSSRFPFVNPSKRYHRQDQRAGNNNRAKSSFSGSSLM